MVIMSPQSKGQKEIYSVGLERPHGFQDYAMTPVITPTTMEKVRT